MNIYSKPVRGRILFLALFSVFISAPIARADVIFLHDYTTNEFVVGSKSSELAVCYAGGNKYINMSTTHTSSFLKRWFGKEKQVRATTHILLDRDVIREIDYVKNRVIDFPLARITDPAWFDRYHPGDMPQAARDLIDNRYEVQPPKFTIKVDADLKDVGGYACSRVVAELHLKTMDKIKNAASITRVTQEMWVTRDIPGYGDVEAFNGALVRRLGIDAARLGVFEGLLDYWHGSLDKAPPEFSQVRGYPVKKEISVHAVYLKGLDQPEPEKTDKEILHVSDSLREVHTGVQDMARFKVPDDFLVVTAE